MPVERNPFSLFALGDGDKNRFGDSGGVGPTTNPFLVKCTYYSE